MVSRLLADLDDRIARTRDPIRNDCLRAERATLLARQGRLEQARTDLEQIRSRHRDRPHAVVTAWICLGEGMVGYYTDLSLSARDRMLRALALSQAIQAREIGALSAAWIAQMDFAALDFPALLQHLAIAIQHTRPSQHSALSRASLVAAQAFHWAERFDMAKPWYEKARHHAMLEGDESMLSALMHNMMWLHVAAYRRRDLFGELKERETHIAELGTDSLFRFDGMVGIASLGALVPMLRAQVLQLEQHYAEALQLFELHAPAFVQQNLERLASSVYADIAWCRLKCGDEQGAANSADRAFAAISAHTHEDDRALTLSRVAQVWAELGDTPKADMHQEAADHAWRSHAQRQRQVVAALEELLAGTGVEGSK